MTAQTKPMVKDDRERHRVVIVGGGQAGLAMSYCLKKRGIEHVILEKRRIAEAWRSERWDSFCLVTPNWQCKLPGFLYAGPDPDGFMLKDEIVDYVVSYARSFDAPVREGIAVTGIRPAAGGFEVDVASHEGHPSRLSADHVVIAIGGYHAPRIPEFAAHVPDGIVQLDSATYRNPETLPSGDVLVVGSGQSGCQIAEDLHLAGRKVHLCLGNAPRAPRMYRGRDVVAWLEDLGHYDRPLDTMEDPETTRKKTNHYVTGRDGGREIDLRIFAQEGMHLYGLLENIEPGGMLHLTPDVAERLDAADATYLRIRKMIDAHIEKNGLDAPVDPPYVPGWYPTEEITRVELETSGVRSIIWCIGFRHDFGIVVAPVFDDRGYPRHTRGVTTVEGLYFLGLPWLYTWGSGRFGGVGRDAEYLADRIANLLANPSSPP